MTSDAITTIEAQVDAIPFSSWWESRRVARATAFRLLKVAGITPGRMKVPTSRAPISVISADQAAALDALAAQLRNGRTLAQLEASATTALAARPGPSQTTADDPGPSCLPVDSSALLARLEAGERAIATGLPLTTAEIAWLIGARPGGAVVHRGGITATRHGRNCWTLQRCG